MGDNSSYRSGLGTSFSVPLQQQKQSRQAIATNSFFFIVDIFGKCLTQRNDIFCELKNIKLLNWRTQGYFS